MTASNAMVRDPALHVKKLPLVPGCHWVADNLLVRTRRAAKLALPQALLRDLSAAGVASVVNLLSKEEFPDAETESIFCPGADAHDARSRPSPHEQTQIFMFHMFWPEADRLPSARQVRQALESIEDAHAIGLRVLVNGVGDPARAALVAGCWLAREGHGCGHDGATRFDWLDDVRIAGAASAPVLSLSTAERAFVAEWPTGREGQPELADMKWSEHDEVFPFAPAKHWLRVLPTVRVYTTARGRTCFMNVPVLEGQRVSDGADIDLDLEELRRGTWIGERTLRLPNGWQVVFVSPHS